MRPSSRRTVASVGVFGLLVVVVVEGGDAEKLNEPQLPHIFIHRHQNSQLTQREDLNRGCTLLTPLKIQQSSKATASPTSAHSPLRSAVTFQRQLSSLIYLNASPPGSNSSRQPLASNLGITSAQYIQCAAMNAVHTAGVW